MTLAKLYLYKAKMMDKSPNVLAFKNEIRNYYNVCKYQATVSLQLHKFHRKWQIWEILLN
jgi:hypothetical protein